MIFKTRLFIEALCKPLFTKHAHCKPLFPFQNIEKYPHSPSVKSVTLNKVSSNYGLMLRLKIVEDWAEDCYAD